MPQTRNLGLIFTRVPDGAPVIGKDLQVQDRPIDLDTAEPDENSLLIKNLYFSLDPFQRGRMRESFDSEYTLNEPMINSSVSIVLKSKNPKFQVGDTITIFVACPIEEYTLLPASLFDKIDGFPIVSKVNNPRQLDLKHFLHALGMPGLTAYASFYEVAGPKFTKGETIFISSAAGAVGQVVGQLAKREGLRVIGSVGSDDKLEFIKELGFDDGWNYKKQKPGEALAQKAPDGIDIYYENVGGEQLEAAISAMNQFGRIVVCGMISQYNIPPQEQYSIKNLMSVLTSRIKMQGFVVTDANQGPKYTKEHQENVMKWLADGSLKVKIDVTEGIENAAEGLVGMLAGKNFGKAVLKV